jgi:hypothetical protein
LLPATGIAASPQAGAAACSGDAAAATATKARFMVDPTTGKTPIGQVLCGPFFGRGTQGMAATVAVPGCGISVGWAVFRPQGASWTIVLKQFHGVLSLALVDGTDIRETQGVLAPGDSHCFPSSHRSREWHWNGRRFSGSAWHLTQAKTVHLDHFLSPSHNIWCNDGDEDIFHCSSGNRPHSVSLNAHGSVTICDPCAVNTKLYDTGRPVAGSPELAYGHADEIGPYRCLSQTKGVTCTISAPGRGHGRGFLINAAGIKRI